LRGDRAFVGDEQTRKGRTFSGDETARGGCTSLEGRGFTSLSVPHNKGRTSQGAAESDSLARARKNVAVTLLYTLSIHVIAWTGNQIQGVVSAYHLLQVDVTSVLFQVSNVKTRLLVLTDQSESRILHSTSQS
jgi:hypothetical protein